jgi:hypothetical protein
MVRLAERDELLSRLGAAGLCNGDVAAAAAGRLGLLEDR